MRKLVTLSIMLFVGLGMCNAQKSLEAYYKAGKSSGNLDLKPEVKIDRSGLSILGSEFADSLESIYKTAIDAVPQITKDGFLSNGVGKYFAKKELAEKLDVYELEEYFKYRNSRYYDYSEFFANIDTHIGEAELRAKESLFYIINEDCRNPLGYERFGNLECWAENVEAYMKKKEIVEDLKRELVGK